jgi:rhodanese-related sulfurtransferase
MLHPPEVTPTEFRQKWPDEAAGDVVLLDVREPDELAIAQIDGAVHIPMREIPVRIAELDRRRPIVVMCHVGGRSRRVAELLLVSGFADVANLAGGIDAWSREIDPTIARY